MIFYTLRHAGLYLQVSYPLDVKRGFSRLTFTEKPELAEPLRPTTAVDLSRHFERRYGSSYVPEVVPMPTHVERYKTLVINEDAPYPLYLTVRPFILGDPHDRASWSDVILDASWSPDASKAQPMYQASALLARSQMVRLRREAKLSTEDEEIRIIDMPDPTRGPRCDNLEPFGGHGDFTIFPSEAHMKATTSARRASTEVI